MPTEEPGGPRVDPAYKGMEIQVLDDASDRYKDIKPWQHHGSIYGVVPAKTGALKPAGEWNSEENHEAGECGRELAWTHGSSP